MKNINKIAKIITKIIEIAHWVAAALMAAVGICTGIAPKWIDEFFEIELLNGEAELSAYGFEVSVIDHPYGKINLTATLLFAIGAVIIFILMAMIFRNLHLIIKRSENSTPFQKDNIRMLTEISIFSIAVPVVGLIMSTIIRLVIGTEATEVSVDLDGLVMGIIILCLTQFFIHGALIEKDIDGLL